jgi:iron complex outermembrane recepter protein
MKTPQFLYCLLSVGALSFLAMPAVAAPEPAPVTFTPISRIKNLNQPATTVNTWLAQVEAATTQVTNVTLNRTDTGLEIILDTQDGKALQVDASQFTTQGNALTAEIPNAVLTLPDGQPFQAVTPTADITQISVEQSTASRIRITVAGNQAPPKTDVTLKVGAFAYSLNPTADTPDEEIVVTGESQRGYQVPNSSTATKTDTPLRDIPQSIQVIPRQLLDDRQVTRVEQVADSVPGVQPAVTYGGIPTANFFIRGFNSSFNVYRDGFREFSFANPIRIAGVEQIEFLKGPASVLYGQNEPGGLVNITSKQPLRQPYYSPALTIGSFNFYQGALDLSGPLNPQKTAAYRLNVAYENAGSFRDFVDTESIFVAPVFSFQLGSKTKLTLNFEYQNYNLVFDRGFPAEPEIFQVPTSRFLGEPDFDDATGNLGRGSYILEHQFNENWKLRHTFAAAIANLKTAAIYPGSLQADRRNVDRFIGTSDENQENYTLQTEVSGKFKTGAIEHQLLVGIELFRYRFNYQFSDSTIAPLDLFNPIYGAQPDGPFVDLYGETTYGTDAVSLYLQDQITLSKQWKLLAGGRLDLAHTTSREELTGNLTTDNTDFAFSPRVGLVYQPSDRISLYASYATAFNPVIFGTSRTGAAFDPETGRQFEVGIKGDLIPGRLSATLAAYDITKKHVLISDPEDDRFSLQTGEQKSRGIEFNLVGQPVSGWDVALSYAYTDAFVSEDTTIPVGDQLTGSAKHQFGLWNSYQIQRGSLKGFGLGLGLYYVSDREAVLPNTAVDLPSYFRVDAAIFYKRDNWKFQLNVNNLTNVDIYNARGNGLIAPQPPISVLGTISYTF